MSGIRGRLSRIDAIGDALLTNQVVNPLSASASGSLGQQIAAAANPTYPASRDLNVPNGVDVFGFNGVSVTRSSITNTDTSIASPGNLSFGGWTPSTGTTTYQVASTITGRAPGLRLRTGASANNVANLIGVVPLTNAVRYARGETIYPLFGFYSYLVIEANIVTPSLALNDFFVGWADGADVISTTYACGALFQPSVDATNWLAFGNDNTALTRTSIGVAGSTSAVTRIFMFLAAGVLSVSINGSAYTQVGAADTPTGLVYPQIAVVTRTAAAKDLHVEWMTDSFQ